MTVVFGVGDHERDKGVVSAEGQAENERLRAELAAVRARRGA